MITSFSKCQLNYSVLSVWTHRSEIAPGSDETELLFETSELWAGWLWHPLQSLFIFSKMSLSESVLLYFAPGCPKPMIRRQDWTTWSQTVSSVILNNECTPAGDRHCSTCGCLNSVAPPTSPTPYPIYSLLNLIDRARYLQWVSGRRGFGNGTEMSLHGDGMKVISMYVPSHYYYISTNLSWMIYLASGGVSACKWRLTL